MPYRSTSKILGLSLVGLLYEAWVFSFMSSWFSSELISIPVLNDPLLAILLATVIMLIVGIQVLLGSRVCVRRNLNSGVFVSPLLSNSQWVMVSMLICFSTIILTKFWEWAPLVFKVQM